MIIHFDFQFFKAIALVIQNTKTFLLNTYWALQAIFSDCLIKMMCSDWNNNNTKDKNNKPRALKFVLPEKLKIWNLANLCFVNTQNTKPVYCWQAEKRFRQHGNTQTSESWQNLEVQIAACSKTSITKPVKEGKFQCLIFSCAINDL